MTISHSTNFMGPISMDWTRNNIETSLWYRVADTVDVFATWSVGHRGVVNQELDNEYLFGVRVNF